MIQKTPYLRPLRSNGATLYVFPSAHEDIGLNLNSRATGVALSHYALLNLGSFVDPTPSKKSDANNEMAEDLQNYVMNFETLLLNQDNYNYQDYHTVSERVFWHWMVKRGYITISKTNNYYKEDITDNGTVVKCFGSIDAGNSLSTEFGMFNETYINIPTSYGSGPVYFKVCDSDTNYLASHSYTAKDTNLQGRNNNTGAYLENNTALYDKETKYITNENNSIDRLEILKNISDIQTNIREEFVNTNIIINSYDDINIDQNNQLNNSVTDFNFNAILLYYSVYDQDDTTKSPYAINLFGIIFLDGFKKLDNVYTIPSITKKKSTDSYFGNSYSFRVNIKTMSVYDNTDAHIQDNTTLSSIYSVDFSDVVSNLNRAIDVMNTNVHTTMAIQDEYMKIRTYYDEQYNMIKDISTKLNGLVFGSPTDSLNTSTLLSNLIIPQDNENNEIKLQVYNTNYNDLADNVNNVKYTPSVSVKNIYNIPALYYPQVDISTAIQTTVFNNIDNTDYAYNLIANTSINWYKTYEDKVYPIIELPNDINVDSLEDNAGNINYNLLLTCILGYLKEQSQLNGLSEEDYNNLAQLVIHKIQNIGITDLIKTEVDKVISDKVNTPISNITKNISSLQVQVDNLSNMINDSNNSNDIDINDVTNSIQIVNNKVLSLSNILDIHIKDNKQDISTLKEEISNIDKKFEPINKELNNIWIALNNQKQSIDYISGILKDTNNKLVNVLQWQKE